ncbi:hypothetical protein [Corynebacterium glyciniphilum]|uniref:hypothetical protein n=1 Tax=Corynebacterium glyciniphilum TaxID=1404244 RepID=UPI0026500FA8|nr:hypothetical protein [Corynebacterium glyciniphilum]MDN6706410.1 hypothetical protein [Corynebacterium glyciniphilum]
MATTEDVKHAREAYLKEHPFDPHKNALMGHDLDGNPAGFLTLPDMGELEVTAMKLGMEYLAICHDEDLVTEWVGTVMSLAGSTELAGVMFAHIFRGMDAIVAARIGTRNIGGLTKGEEEDNRAIFAKIAADGWAQHFGGNDE